MRKSSKTVISSETLWKALRRELPEKQFSDLVFSDADFEEDDYYDYPLLCIEFKNCIAGKTTYGELMEWLILFARCLSNSNAADKKIRAEYGKLISVIYDYTTMYIDPSEYNCVSKNQKRFFCRKLFAQVKWSNHKINCLVRGKRADFTTGGVITCVSSGFTLDDGRTRLVRACIVNKNRGRINYMYVEEADYREDINYTLLSEAEFDDLSSIYSNGYKLDPAMSADYAAKKVICGWRL